MLCLDVLVEQALHLARARVYLNLRCFWGKLTQVDLTCIVVHSCERIVFEKLGSCVVLCHIPAAIYVAGGDRKLVARRLVLVLFD